MSGYRPDYWDGVRTGENDGETPWEPDRGPSSRYRVLRDLGCGIFTSAVIASLNELMRVPKNEIRFLSVVIEIDQA